MADRLAGLVLPDATPVENPADDAPPEKPKEKHRRPDRAPAAGLFDTVSRFRRGDWLLAAGGIALAGICAVFPWYIFFNQEQFGVRPLAFSGSQQPDALLGLAPHQPLGLDAMPQLDFAPTATVPETPVQANLSEQPFPGDRRPFRFIHAENGRGIIEDEDGFWIVQKGSFLPDGSRVVGIEQRSQNWVLVTSTQTEIPLSR